MAADTLRLHIWKATRMQKKKKEKTGNKHIDDHEIASLLQHQLMTYFYVAL